MLYRSRRWEIGRGLEQMGVLVKEGGDSWVWVGDGCRLRLGRMVGDRNLKEGRGRMSFHQASELDRGDVRGDCQGVNTEENGVAIDVEFHGEGGIVRDDEAELLKPLNVENDVGVVDRKNMKVN